MYEDKRIEDNLIENKFSEIEGELSERTKEIINFIYETDFDNSKIDKLVESLEGYIPIILVMYYRSGALFEEFKFGNFDFEEIKFQKNKENLVFSMLEKIMHSEYIFGLTKTILDQYKFSVLVSDEDFLICDQYISTCALKIKNRFVNYSNRTIGFKDTLILIPLNKKLYLCFFHNTKSFEVIENKYNFLSASQMETFNKVIVNNSYVKFAGAQKNTMEKSLEGFEYKSPTTSQATFDSGVKVLSILKKEVFFYSDDVEKWEYFVFHKWINMQETKRNDPCPCGSNKKFKYCCIEKYKESKIIIDKIRFEPNYNYSISKNNVIEKQIKELYTL